MATTQTKSIMPGVVCREGVQGKSVRFSAMIRGERFTETCALPYAALVNPKTGKPTPALKQAYAEFLARHRREVGWSDGKGLKVPTIGEFVTTFSELVWKRTTNPAYRMEERTAETAVKNLKMCVAESGLRYGDELTKLMSTSTVRRIYESFRQRMEGTSAWSYVMSLQSATADWTREQYAERGMQVAKPIMPDVGTDKDPPRYRKLPREIIAKIEDTYLHMDEFWGSQEQLGVTIVYNLAVRPGDVARLTKDNFVQNEIDGYWHICYGPHKTAKSSKRHIDYPIPTALYERIRELAGERWDAGLPLIGNRRTVFDRINAGLRVRCGMKSEDFPKAIYELRKLCIHTIYHQRGSQAASALAGDNQSTIEYYYADPGAVTNVEPLMVAPSSARTAG